jgi:hypothetical protein
MESENVTINNLSKFYQMKKERYEKQLERKLNLLKQGELYKKSKVKKSIQALYYYSKKSITAILAILLILMALGLWFVPNWLIGDEDYQVELIESIKEEYLKEFGRNISDALIEIAKDDYVYDEDEFEDTFFKAIDLALEKSIKEDVNIFFRLVSILLILFALVLFSSIRLNKKLRKSNLRINEVEIFSQSTIKEFSIEVEEAAKELKLLEGIINES